MYYIVDYLTPPPSTGDDITSSVLVSCIHFCDPVTNPAQKFWMEIFAPLLKGLKHNKIDIYHTTYANTTYFFDPLCPYGYRRGFWGPQTSNISTSYLESTESEFSAYLKTLTVLGDDPLGSFWTLQYVYPGLNGNLPATADATGWLHDTFGQLEF